VLAVNFSASSMRQLRILISVAYVSNSIEETNERTKRRVFCRSGLQVAASGVNGSVSLKRWIDAKGKVSRGTEVTQWGPEAKTLQADTYFGNGCKTDILRSKK